MKRTNIGIVGCGDISGIYLQNITTVFSDNLKIIGVCDLIPERAGKAAGIVNEAAGASGDCKIYKDMHELFADPNVDIVLNLTRPYEHYGVGKPAILAGKNVYSEKPLGATLDEGLELVALAKEKGVLLGGAPDTFLGAGIQTCGKLIDDGYIGTPVGATAFMVCRGHESWHPDPEFYYKHGGGPMLDMGPYYITAMVSLLGGVKAVTGMARASFPTRLITSEPKKGTVVDVDVPTYIMGLLEFESGAIGSIFTTFDAYKAETPRIEIYGSAGTLSVPDPNTFGGDVRLYRPEEKEFLKMPLVFPFAENSRALGLDGMARGLGSGDFKANCGLTLHVLEVMSGIISSGGNRIEIKNGYKHGNIR